MNLKRLVSVALLLGVASLAAAQGLDKLYVIDCGWVHAPDQSRWSPGVNVGVPIDLSGNCYLIHHTSGAYMLWDTGITDAVTAMPNSQQVPANPQAPVWHRPKTLLSQLAELGVKPADLKYIAISHFHPDHSGNVDEFPTVPLMLQKAEWDAAMALPLKPFSPEHPVIKLEGDKDVFGDGSVTILSTPGHTPGHESLLVHLKKTGYVVLSGDVAHFQSNWDNRRVPGFNFSQDQSKASMQRVADILKEHHAELWINHDKPHTDGQKHSPAFYE